MTLKENKEKVDAKVQVRREACRSALLTRMLFAIDSHSSTDDSDITVRWLARAISEPVANIYNYFSDVSDVVTQLFIETMEDFEVEDKKTAFFDFYMARPNEAKLFFDLKNGIRLDQIEWFDNSCKEKLGYIVAKILESDNE